MVGNMFKVVHDYEPPNNGNNSEYLRAEKGDILTDCESLDDVWFRGKNMMNENIGIIPKSFVEAFISNDIERCTESICVVYEHADLDDPVSSDGVAKQNSSQLTTNPLLDAVDDLLDREYTDIEDNLSKYREPNYVDMSSGETLNEQESTPLNSTIQTEKQSKVPVKPRRSIHDVAKSSDDGYNSGSHYSGENNESAVPLLTCHSRQDDAGYEVPHNVIGLKDEQDNGSRSEKNNKAKEKLKFPFNKFSHKKTIEKVRKHSQLEEDREKFYNPPPDRRDNYFMPTSSYPGVRVLITFIVALGLSLGLLLVLHILCGFHPVLCFVLALLVFSAVMVTQVTLLIRGTLCVMLLLFPSLVSTRAKICLVIVLIVSFICGPILGIVDKANFTTECDDHHSQYRLSTRFRKDTRRYRLENDCFGSFMRVNQYCTQTYQRFNRVCSDYSPDKLTTDEKVLCNKRNNEFCSNRSSIRAICSVKENGGDVISTTTTRVTQIPWSKQTGRRTDTAREMLLYLMPLLFLLIMMEAYTYNQLYLSTKHVDNIYITQRLKELDSERKNRGLSDLIFPLTRIEFHSYMVRKSFGWSKSEREAVWRWFLVFLVVLLSTVCLVAFENRIETIVLLTIDNECNLEGGNQFRTLIYILNGVLLFVIFIQSHVLRSRAIICEYFYPDMIDIRSKYLYYKILHDRHTFARYIRRNIQLLSEEKRMTSRVSFTAKIYNVLPSKLQSLCRKLTVRRCMICNSLSYRKTIECEETNCRAHYCYECFVDAGQQCLTCKNTTERSNSIAI